MLRRVFPRRIGEPMFSGRQLRALLIPLIIEQILSATVGIADTVMVAQVGEHAMSGVSLVDSINMLLINIFAALSTGGTIITAQYLGRQEEGRARESARQAIMITTALALIIAIVSVTFRGGILRGLYRDIETSVMDSALIYFLLTAMAYPFIAVFGSCAAISRATGNSKLPMTVSIVMNLMNIVGNAIFIFIFHMGAAGAALSTLISRIFAAAVMFISLRNPKLAVHIRGMLPLRLNIPMIKNILAIGVPTGIENGIFQIGKVIVQSFISGMGTASIAAAAVANSMASITIMPGMAIGMGLVTVAGQCVGAGRFDQVRRYAVGFTFLSMLAVAVINSFIFIFMEHILAAYGVADGTASLAREIITILLIGTISVWPLGFTLPNALRSANDVKYTMLVAIGSMWAFRVGLGYLLSVVMEIGVVGIWYGMMADWLFRMLMYVVRFCGTKWEHHKILET